MRALTLTQPFAGLVASGIKLVENRDRSIIKREDFGKPFALHASREIKPDVYELIYEIAPELRPVPAATKERARWYQLSRITSAVIAVATVDRAVNYHDRLDAKLGAQRRWYVGPIGYVLRDVYALLEPVPCRGYQPFWTLPPHVEARVVAQLGRTP
ncbi:MAG TPA: hypothetical protein VIX73_33010 [Kofleriaceae bacterium]